MNLRVTTVLLLLLGVPCVGVGAESMQPQSNAPTAPLDFARYATLQRIQVYADYCSRRVPSLQGDFSGLMRVLAQRVSAILAPIAERTATDPKLKGALPKEFIDAYEAWNDQLRTQLEAHDAGKECPRYLANYSGTTDECFRNGLEHSLEGERMVMRQVHGNK